MGSGRPAAYHLSEAAFREPAGRKRRSPWVLAWAAYPCFAELALVTHPSPQQHLQTYLRHMLTPTCSVSQPVQPHVFLLNPSILSTVRLCSLAILAQ